MRPRLARRLQSWRQARLITVTAPAGYGKTTFAAAWTRTISAENLATLGWISLDEDDNEPLQFIAYLAGALDAAIPGIASSVEEVIASRQMALKQALGSITNALGANGRPTLLVLDDYHLITEQAVHSAMDLLLERAPRNFHCLLLTRRTPPLALSRFRVRGQLLDLTADELKFTLEESQEFFAAALPETANANEVEQIATRMDGWGAGMRLAALAVRETVTWGQSRAASPREQEMVAEYIVSEVLERLPERIRLFLLQTSILDDLSPSLCQAVTLQPDSAKLLAQVAETIALVTQLDSERRTYRYHHLLRDVLRRQLDLSSTTAARQELHDRAAIWLGENGDVDGALRHFDLAGNLQAAVHLVESRARPMLLSGEVVAVDRWLGKLPAQAAAQQPRLALDSAWLSVFAERADLPEKVSSARHAVAVAREQGHECDRWQYELLALEGSAALVRSDADGLFRISQSGLAVIPAQYALERGVCHSLQMIHYRRRGEADKALEHSRSGLNCFIQAGSHIAELSILRTTALIYYDAGRATEAVHTFRRQLEYARTVQSNLGGETDYSILHFGMLLYQLNQLSEAKAQFEHLLESSRRIDDKTFTLCALLWLKLCTRAEEPWQPVDTSSLATEEMMLREAYDLRSPALQSQACQASILCRLRERNVAAAWRAAQLSGLNIHQPPTIGHIGTFLAYMHAYRARGRSLEAVIPALQQWETFLDKTGRVPVLKLQFRVLTVLLQAALGKHMGALKALDEALHLVAASGYVRFVLDYVDELRPLLERSSHSMARAILEEAETAGQLRRSPLLSEVELRVLRQVAAGHTRKEVAATLYLSENTVKTHLSRIYAKLGATSKAEALATAQNLGLLAV